MKLTESIMMKPDFFKRVIFAVFLVVYTLSCFGQDHQKEARLQLQFSEQDSNKFVTAVVNEVENNVLKAPVKDIAVHFYVQRTFSLFPFGEEDLLTDSSGKVTAKFPADLPGDSLGNVTIVVKLENLAEYPDAEVRKVEKWGIPVISNNNGEKRSLWAAGANAPISLLILVNSLIAAVWGIIFFIFFKIYKISRM